MHDIFNPDDNKNLLDRLDRLTADTRPGWGKMNASQMVLHCQKPLDVATGKLPLKSGLLGFLFGKMVKNKFLREGQIGKNSPTVAQFKIVETPEFETEKATLASLIRQFGEKGPSIIANKKHPFFGRMTDEEWGVLQYVHLDHHLRQFGV